MKTLTHKILATLVIMSLASALKGQSLIVKGFFLDKKNKAVNATYVLKKNDTEVEKGKSRKVKFRLDADNYYTLVVSKKGYETKILNFSTCSQDAKNFHLVFDMHLKPLKRNEKIKSREAGSVFFDEQKQKYSVTVK